tara:strand:- start:9933 stop:10178 length:246 start_codon:yes stop_codon:yes gene_type:complete
MYSSTKIYNTGYLPEYSNILRIQQGLPSQFISNICLDTMIYQKQYKQKDFNTLYYPIKAAREPFIGPLISCDDPCLRWIYN